MALLDILIFPDQRLKQVAEPVQQIDDNIKKIVNDMFETMYHGGGIGLAATQVNIHKRIVVIHIQADGVEQAPLCLINPVITQFNGNITWQEGCLSFPNVFTKVKRHETVTVEYQDLTGKAQVLAATGLLSICCQHELDHINGITLYERISPLRRTLLDKKLKFFKKK